MYKHFFLPIIFLAISYNLVGQTNYLIGTSSVSIEPDNTIFSTALAGYGAPRAGRFSLSWKYISDVPDITSLTGVDGKFFIATSDEEVMIGKLANDQIIWNEARNNNKLTSLSNFEGKLYATNDKNQLFKAAISKDKVSWKKIGTAENVTSATNLNGDLYSIGDAGKIFKNIGKKEKLKWESISQPAESGRFISLTSDDKNLYALNSGDSIWIGEPSQNTFSWRLIGRNNSLTYNIHIKHILVLNNRLFAVSNDNKLYINEHSTEGNLTTSAIAVTNKDKTVVIITLDLCGFENSLANDIRERISKQYNIQKSAILFNASHTHFAPVTQRWHALGPFYGTPDQKYLNNIVKKGILKAVEQAMDSMEPSSLYFSRGSTDIGYNRRSSVNPEAPNDKVLDVLKIQDENNELSNVVFVAGCHPVFKNSGKATYTISANYPGVTREIIKDKMDADNAIFIQGPGGDINPKADNYQATGKELADDVLNVLKREMQQVSGEISFHLDTIEFPVTPMSLDQVKKFKNENLKPPGDIVAERNVRWADIMLNHYEQGTMPTTLPVYVQTINIGDWKLVGLSREVVNDYGPAIRNIWPDKLVSVAGYCNDISSYLPVDWHIESGVYEGKGSFLWYGVSGFFPVDVKTKVIERIKMMNR